MQNKKTANPACLLYCQILHPETELSELIASDVYCRNKLVSHRKESVKWPYKSAFYAFMHNRKSVSVDTPKLEHNVVVIGLILSFQCHLVLSIISVFCQNLISYSVLINALLFQKRYND